MNGPGRDMIGKTIAHYRVLRLLGRGGMGEVYLAQDTSLPRKVALKLLPEDKQQDAVSRTRLLREAESAATITHPFICSIHEIGEFEGTDFIAMEYVEGQSLKDRLEQDPFPVSKALPIAAEIVEALDKAQSQGIVHRDLKPSNIMLTAEGHPKILDFGLAKRLAPLEGVESEDQTITNLTQQGSTVGTPAYMSPEQVRGQPADVRSDIFSFGIVLYEMLTGVHPFYRPHAMETASAILRDEPAPLARHVKDASELLEHVVGKTLAKDPEDRYQSARELRTDLRRLVEGHTAGPKAWSGWSQRLATIALAAILAVALGAAFAFWLSWDGGIPEETQILEEGTISLVAIPARVVGPEEEIWRTEAIPESVSLLLAGQDWLDVKVPPTSLQAERVQGDFARIGQEYGVQRCLLFSWRVESDRMLLEVQLADPASLSILWHEAYEAGLGDYNEMVKEASLGVLAELRPSVSPVISDTVLAANSQAEEALRQGEYHSNRFNSYLRPEDLEAALRSFERALELDPNLAKAAAEIAFLKFLRIERGGPPSPEAIDEILQWANRALEISDDCARAWVVLGAVETRRPSPSRGRVLQYSLKAVQLDPRDAISQMSLGISGLPLPMALEAKREAGRLSPLFRFPLVAQASDLGRLGRASEGLSLLERLLSLDPDFHHAHTYRATLLIRSGKLEDARVSMEKMEALAKQNRLPGILVQSTRLMLAAQAREEGIESLYQAVLRMLVDPRMPAHLVYMAIPEVVPILARQGFRDQAIELIRLIDSRGHPPQYEWLFLDPDMESLREEPALEDILTRSRAAFEKVMTALQNARFRDELPEYLVPSFEELLEFRRSLPPL